MTTPHNRRQFLAYGVATLASLSTPAWSAPRRYNLSARNATIGFDFSLSGVRQNGSAPLKSADLRIDVKNLAASQATVTADISRAKTGFIFATDALKSASVLDTANHPTASFRSTKVTLGANGRLSEGATLAGELTLRGVTRTVRFDAALYRPAGSAADSLDQLEVHLKGAINRNDFGATGYPDLVDPIVGLNIRAEIAVSE